MRNWTGAVVLLGVGSFILVSSLGAQTAPLAPQAPTIHVTELRSRPRPRDTRPAAIMAAISPAQIKAYDNKLVSFGTRVSLSDNHPSVDGQPPVPAESTATRGVIPAREWIESEYKKISKETGGRLQVSLFTTVIPKGPRIPIPQYMSDVVATLPGTDPNDKRIFLVSGHYDSIPADFKLDAPGANDDASGTIVSLECARALSRFKFPATIIFLAVEGEEQGLYGSRAFAEHAKAEGWDIAGMLNNDIVGGDQTPGHANTNVLRVFSQGVPPIPFNASPQEVAAHVQQLRQIIANSWENDSPSRELARFAAEIAQLYVPGFEARLEYRPDRFQRGGDETSFVNAGYPAVRFTEYHENGNHQHLPVSETKQGVLLGDRGRWISPAYIAQVARVNALTLEALASSPLPPQHVYFRGGQQIGTPVQWTPVAGAAGYRILLRPTASPQWTLRIVAPPVAAPPPPGGMAAGAPQLDQIMIPQSPDNYILAMVAVDKDGHESLPRLGTAMPYRGFGRGRGGRGRGGRGRGDVRR